MVDWNNETSTPFEQLSDGQSAIVGLMADISRRMCLLNPQLGNDVLQATPGIILIDELDIHLHPGWQRRIPHVLKDVYPQVQFIAASHSPQIIGELPAEEIWLLRDGKVRGHPDRSFGLSSGEVLEELMGGSARNPEVAKDLQAIRRMLDQDRLQEAEQALSELRKRVDEIPEVLELQGAADSLKLLDGEE